MNRVPGIALALAIVLLTAGCGGGGEDRGEEAGTTASAEVPGGGDPEDVEVIDAWSDALREGDVAKAAGYFALPSVVTNGTPLLKLTDRQDAEDFNDSLPCGATLVKATSEGKFTTATFELTDRPGGGCGPGIGGTARTTFVIEDGKITEWTRVGDEPQAEGDLI